MKLIFKEEGHIYESDPPINWTSVTKVIEGVCPIFDSKFQAIQSSMNHKSKWFGIGPDNIKDIWDFENLRSTIAGTWVHNKFENELIDKGYKMWEGLKLKVFPSKYENGIKTAPPQELVDGVYPEHFIYNEKLHICGQADVVIVRNGIVDIIDYKTNKKIEEHSYGWDRGWPTMMKEPVNHLEDCNLFHYGLQLGMYMRLILLKNPHLKPGKIILIHIKLEVAERNIYGFPVLQRTEDEGYVIEESKKYNLKYLENDVRSLLKDHYLKL